MKKKKISSTKITILIITSLFFSLVFKVAAQEFWAKLPGPEGGWVWTMKTDKTGGQYDGTLFLGTYGGGIFRSTDGGGTWVETNEGMGDFYIYDIAIGDGILAATSNGIFKSNDNGDSWQLSSEGLPEGEWRALLIDPSGKIFAGENGSGVYISTNSGENWTGPIGTGLVDGRIRDLAISGSGELFAAGRKGVHRSRNNGETWTQISEGFIDSLVLSLTFFQDDAEQERILAGTFAGAFISMNNGDSWQERNTNLSNLEVRSTFVDGDKNLYLGTENGVFKSVNFGDGWFQSGIEHKRIHCFTTNDVENLFAGSAGAGIFRSSDIGDSWSVANRGFNSGPINDVAINANNELFISMRRGGLYFSSNNGFEWQRKDNGLENKVIYEINLDHEGNVYAGTLDGLYFSNDKGNTWQFKGLSGLLIQAIDINSSGQLFAGTWEETREFGGLYRSNDNGATWSRLEGVTDIDVPEILIVSNTNSIFAGSWNTGIYRSTDNGDTWTQVNEGLNNLTIRTLAVNGEGHIFVGTDVGTDGGGIYRSQDNGDSWTEVNNGLSNPFIRKITINSLGHLYIGSGSEGVFFSNDNGDSWQLVNNGMPYPTIYDLALNTDEYLLAATGGGIFYSVFPTVLSKPLLAEPADGAVNVSNNPLLEWNPVSGAESYIIEISKNPEFTDIVLRQDEIFANFYQASDLDSWTSYNWRVRAVNFTGQSDWSDIWDFTTKLASPVLSAPADGSVNIPLNPTLNWSAVSGASTYDVEISEEMNFNGDVGRYRGITGTSLQISELNTERTYYWHVNSNDGTNTSDWSSVWSFSTFAFPNLVTQPADVIGTVSARLNASVNPRGHRVNVGFEYGENPASPEFGILATADPIQGSNDRQINIKVSGLRTGTEYYFRAVASQVDELFDQQGDFQSFITQAYPSTFDVTTTLNFPAHGSAEDFQSTDYKMLGLPGQQSDRLNISSFLSGEHKKDWQAYWDNGSTSDNAEDYLIAYNGTDRFKLGNGKALWVINKGDVDISENGINAIALDSEDKVTIALHPGWNMITNPFNYPIPWWQIDQENSLGERPIFWFDNGWKTQTIFEPYKGYYFNNNLDPALSSLTIPYSGILQKPVLETKYNWQVKIKLRAGKISESATSFGTSNSAKAGLDDLDFRKPRAVGSVPSVNFIRPGWDKNCHNFACDIRPPIEASESWKMMVNSYPDQVTELYFEGIEAIPAVFDVYLINQSKYKFQDLRENNTYLFKPETNTSHFEIMVGQRDLILEHVSQIMPQDFVLGKNYPNPFNPTTYIPVTVPERSNITLKVYDVLGREIQTLYEGVLEPGRHFFSWSGINYDGNKVSAGIYLYKLSLANSASQLGKMIMIK